MDSIFLSVCRSFIPSGQEDVLISLFRRFCSCPFYQCRSLSLAFIPQTYMSPTDASALFFQTKIAETIAARPLDSTQATRAAHAAQSGCAATPPLTGRRGVRGLTGGSQPGYREKCGWSQMIGRPHTPHVLLRADPSRHSRSTWRSHAASWPANKKSATRSRAARRRARSSSAILASPIAKLLAFPSRTHDRKSGTPQTKLYSGINRLHRCKNNGVSNARSSVSELRVDPPTPTERSKRLRRYARPPAQSAAKVFKGSAASARSAQTTPYCARAPLLA